MVLVGNLGRIVWFQHGIALARDVPELVDWISGRGQKPRSLDEALFQRDRLLSLRSRLSAAYKGLHALLMKTWLSRFLSATGVELMTFFNDRIDIHHVFPQALVQKNGISPNIYNSIVNKTALSNNQTSRLVVTLRPFT
jgi:hypothetical protein